MTFFTEMPIVRTFVNLNKKTVLINFYQEDKMTEFEWPYLRLVHKIQNREPDLVDIAEAASWATYMAIEQMQKKEGVADANRTI